MGYQPVRFVDTILLLHFVEYSPLVKFGKIALKIKVASLLHVCYILGSPAIVGARVGTSLLTLPQRCEWLKRLGRLQYRRLPPSLALIRGPGIGRRGAFTSVPRAFLCLSPLPSLAIPGAECGTSRGGGGREILEIVLCGIGNFCRCCCYGEVGRGLNGQP